MTIEALDRTEIHTQGGCNGTIRTFVDYRKKEVVSVCTKCRRGSIVRGARVVAENVQFKRIPGEREKKRE